MPDSEPKGSNWGPILFLCGFLAIGGFFFLEQFRHKGRGSGAGVEYNQDGSIRDVSSDRADKAVRRLACMNSLPENYSESDFANCQFLD